MLPSKKRLSRDLFTLFLSSKDIKTIFNNLGTLKYKKSNENRASIIISSKNEKRAVYRNKLRRRLYSLFADYFKKSDHSNHYILYTSKQSINMSLEEIKNLFNELLKKITK